MERTERAKYFFKTKIKGLIDTIYTPVDDVSDDYCVSYVSRLRGAVWYAFEMGDIDKAERRLYTDQLNELYKIVMDK